MGKIISVNRV